MTPYVDRLAVDLRERCAACRQVGVRTTVSGMGHVLSHLELAVDHGQALEHEIIRMHVNVYQTRLEDATGFVLGKPNVNRMSCGGFMTLAVALEVGSTASSS